MADYKAWMVHILGFSRILEMRGGISTLPVGDLIRKLILWYVSVPKLVSRVRIDRIPHKMIRSDQIGALLMNTQPFFMFPEVISPNDRAVQRVQPPAISQYKLQNLPSQSFRQLLQTDTIDTELFEVITDISYIGSISDNIIQHVMPPEKQTIITVRDDILTRLLYLAPSSTTPDNSPDDSETSDADVSLPECLRLALLLLALDRLFCSTLPSAYFQITHTVADRLASDLESISFEDEDENPDPDGQQPITGSVSESIRHHWVSLWICFIGVAASSNNPRSRAVFVQAASEIMRSCNKARRARGLDEIDDSDEISDGLASVLGETSLFDRAEYDAFAVDLLGGGG